MQNVQEQYFVLTLPLMTQAWQRDILNKRFEIHRQIYNALLCQALTRFRQMAQTRAYRRIQEVLSRTEDEKERKKLFKERDALIEQYRLRKFDICGDTTKYRQYFQEHTDSPVIQNLANEVWQAIDNLIHGRAGQVYFKQPGQMKSLSGKTNRSSIKLRGDCLVWKGLEIPVRRKKNSSYEEQALSQEIRFCRVKKTVIRGKDRYLLDVVLKGAIPLKEAVPLKQTIPLKQMPEADDLNSGQERQRVPRSEEKLRIGCKNKFRKECEEKLYTEREEKLRTGCAEENHEAVNVGLDIGFRKLAVVSEDAAMVYDLPEKDRGLEKKKRELVQYMERSRRSMNPDNYLPDGRIRPGSKEWAYSKNYQKAGRKYREICRKQSVLQRQEQYQLVREIISYGDRFFVENLDFAKLGRRKPNGIYMTGAAPGEFLRILDYKLSWQGKQLYRILPFLVKASGFNHHTGAYQKMPLKKSWRIVDGQKVEKNLYSAFLLSNLAEDMQSFDLERCTEKFPKFLEGQREYLQTLAS